MRGCLLSGAGWSLGGSSTLIDPSWSPEVEKIYRIYLPLVKSVFGAEMLLTPDPVRVNPAGMVKTEIFRSRDKKAYLLSVVFERDTLVPEVKLSVKLPGDCRKKYEVTVLGEKRFEFAGEVYTSLSAVARAITGTRWNGKVFFGVK
ncbi:MAG: DUF2924 domain-containing protein [Lentisphaerae bacterium]|nr:DUF2924 domain-containing protein [Lentisphaerota bacterium]